MQQTERLSFEHATPTWAWAAGGLAVAAIGWQRQSVSLTALGAWLAARAVRRRWMARAVVAQIETETSRQPLVQPHPPEAPSRFDPVEQASWESFPASDPPGY